MGFDFVVLGATGMQGKIVSRDLLESGYSVLLCGRDKKRVDYLLKKFRKSEFEFIEMTNMRRVEEVIKNSRTNMVINCVEGDWDLNAQKACIHARVNYIDLGSEIKMTQDQLALDEEMKKKNLISITGCGSVPGIGSVMLRYASEKFDKINTIECGYSWDSNIKKFVVPFSIGTILDEFTEPSPSESNGKIKNLIPLKNLREAHHRAIGKQKEFPVMHSELYTFDYYFKNKGVKNIRFYAGFPDHSFNVIKAIMDTGLDQNPPISFKGEKIIPWEFLTEVMKGIKMPLGYTETENLWVDIYGTKNGKKKHILMECIVPPLKGWEEAGCNIDTGFPASIIAQMIKNNIITQKGSFAPEAESLIPSKYFFKQLRKKHLNVFENGKQIN